MTEFALGFASALLTLILYERLKRCLDKKERRNTTKKLLQVLCKEIEEGIKRCKHLIELRKKGEAKISFSRIFVDLWDASKLKIAENIDNLEILGCVHQIYYYFDLINFNMEKDRFGVGAAFANDKIGEIEGKYSTLKKLMVDY